VRHHHELLEEYIEEEQIGQGNFGVVYKMRCISDGRVCAVKELRKFTKMPQSDVLREIWTMRRCFHPNLIEMYDGFLCIYPEGQLSLWMVMQLASPAQSCGTAVTSLLDFLAGPYALTGPLVALIISQVTADFSCSSPTFLPVAIDSYGCPDTVHRDFDLANVSSSLFDSRRKTCCYIEILVTVA